MSQPSWSSAISARRSRVTPYCATRSSTAARPRAAMRLISFDSAYRSRLSASTVVSVGCENTARTRSAAPVSFLRLAVASGAMS